MAWGIIMAGFTVFGMLMLIFAQPETNRYQTFGSLILNPPDMQRPDGTESAEQEVRRAA